MTNDLKGLLTSTAVHALFIFIFLYAGSRPFVEDKAPIVIDFSVIESRPSAKESVHPMEEQKRPEKTIERRTESLPIKTTDKPAPAPTSIIEDKPQQRQDPVSTAPLQSASLSDNAVAVPKRVSTGQTPVSQSSQPISSGASGYNTAKNASGPSGGQGSIEAQKAAYMKENYLYVRDMIQKKVVYPVPARQMGIEGKAVVSFIIETDGSVKALEVAESSGAAVLDKGAVEAVIKASPFPRPQSQVKVLIPIVYKLYSQAQ